MADLFSSSATSAPDSYDASSIEVLEGLEPVRRRPGMYIGGTDARALHHLAAEVIDNAMDEAVAGHASRIEVTLEPGNRLTVTDNGRGIPVDPHPKYPGKSALEVIMTTLHSGGKFEGKAYSTSRRPPRRRGQRRQRLVDRDHRRGRARQDALPPDLLQGPRHLAAGGSRRRPQPPRHHRHLHPRPRDLRRRRRFDPERLYKLARSKAYLFAGVEIRWRCDPSLASADVPEQRRLPVPRRPRRPSRRADRRAPDCVTNQPFTGRQDFPERARAAPNGRSPGRSIATAAECYYCNTIPTPDGGTHEAGLRAALTKGIRAFGELVGNKRAKDITADDVFNGVELMLSRSSSATRISRARPRTA